MATMTMTDPRDARTRNAEDAILELHDEIERLQAENAKFRSALEIIAESSTDKLKALQAKGALANIGPKS